MRFSHEYRLLLISNWKCGSSTLARIFSPITEFDWDSRSKCRQFFGRDYATMVHFPASKMKREFVLRGWEFDEYVTISSVRNPWARAVSLFEDLRGRPTDDFDEFLRAGLPHWRSGLRNRWNSYEMFHERGRRIVKYVIRIEYLQQELPPIVRSLWPDLDLDYSWIVNRGDHRPFRDYYTNKQSVERVADFFRYDVETFGYRFDTVAPSD
jgi:hypothetical protein